MEYPAPTPIPTTTNFNSSYFFDITDADFNFETASKYFVKITGGTITGLTSFLAGVNVNGDINTNSLLRVTRSTSGQSFNSSNGSSQFVLYHENSHDCWLGTVSSNNLILQTGNSPRLIINGSSGNISGISSLTAASLIATSTLTVNGISVSSADLAYLSSITPGICSASKALIVDSSRNITNINSLSTTSLIINGIGITSSDLAYLNGITAGTVTASKAVVVDGNKDISSFRNVFATKFCNNASYSSFAIDMGNTASDRLLAVFENGTAFYGLGANGSRLQLHASAGAGIRMYTNSSVASTGTQIFDINSAGLITADSITLDTALTVPLANIRDNAQASGTRTEFLSFGRSSSGSDHGAWSIMNYYQSATQGDSNYITIGPRLRTGLTTGWGMVMTQNGNCSFQNKDSNGGAGGFKIQANIVGTVDIQGGNVRSIGAGHGYLQPNSGSPADYNVSSVSTRIGLWVENSIWCGDKVYSSSDSRLKQDIKTISLDEAKKMLNISSVSYRWRKDTENHMKDIGFIAQDFLENKLDELVSFCPSSDKTVFPLGYSYGLEYQKVCVYQNELIKDLYVQIEELKNEIKLVKN